MKNLTSIAEHSDWLENRHNNSMTKWNLHRLRIEFGKQTLQIWMFVPCKLVDGVWVVLEEPIECDCLTQYDKECCGMFFKCEEYQQAKEKLIFKNFKVNYFDLGGCPIDKNSSFEILSNDSNFQICVYKSKPNYFIWNYKTIEELSKLNIEITENAQKELGV